ncbi:WbuC family cupin fold metalloprotein [Methylomonas sp. YC3]
MNSESFLFKSSDVLVCNDEIVSIDYSVLTLLNQMAVSSPKNRARVCAHKDNTALIQEMIIQINHGSYICPHRHDNKCESFHLIEGKADIVVFKDSGEIHKVIQFDRDHSFYYRLDSNLFHTIVVRSEVLIFHEVTNGPFVQNATEFAKFAPAEGDQMVDDYKLLLDVKIRNWLG